MFDIEHYMRLLWVIVFFAIYKLHKSKLHEKTIPQLMQVAEILHKQPDILLFELAEIAGLAEIHLGRSVHEELTPREERQRREMAAIHSPESLSTKNL